MIGRTLREQGFAYQEPPLIVEVEHEIRPEYTDENVLFFLLNIAMGKAFTDYGARVIACERTGEPGDIQRFERQEGGYTRYFGVGRFYVYLLQPQPE